MALPRILRILAHGIRMTETGTRAAVDEETMTNNEIDAIATAVETAKRCEAAALTGTRADYVAQDIAEATSYWVAAFALLLRTVA